MNWFLKLYHKKLRTYKWLNFINILGLALGFTIFLFIFQYARFEWSYDAFHTDADHIYRVTFTRDQAEQDPYVSASSFPALAPALERDLPEIVSSCRVVPVWGRKGLLVHHDQSIALDFINYADPSFFDFFSFPLVEGNPQQALLNQNTAVLAKSIATKMFGNTSPVGERVELQTRDGQYFFEITGVFDDSYPTHMTSEILLSWTSLYAIPGIDRERIENNWSWTQYPAYVKIKDSSSPEQVVAKFPYIISKYLANRPGSDLISFGLQPLKEIHLKSKLYREIDQNGDAQTVNLFVIIGILTLIIAWVNFVNLYTSKITDRAKHVGIKKVLGAGRQRLFKEFFEEIGLHSFLAIAMAIGALYLFNAQFIYWTGLEMPDTFFLSLEDLLVITSLWVLSTLCCGIYPSWLVTRFDALTAFSGKITSSFGRLRKSLVVFQFMVSGILIGATFIIKEQVTHLNSVDRGTNTDNIVVIDAYLFDQDDRAHLRRVKLYKDILSKELEPGSIAYSSQVIGEPSAFKSNSHLLGQQHDQFNNRIQDLHIVGPDYLELYGIPLLAGRYFEHEADTQTVIISRKSALAYGFDTPESALNAKIVFPGPNDTLRVIGIIEDHIQESLKTTVRPTAFRNNQWEISKISARVNEEQLRNFLTFAEEEFQRVFPKTPFVFHVIEDVIARNTASESSVSNLLNIFSFIAILIALIGVMSLSSHMAEKRLKEVCVRRVLGCTNLNVTHLMFRNFAFLVLLGNVIGLPILYFLSNHWLDQFTSRITFDWSIPLLSLLISLCLALVFSLMNIIKLIRINPAVILRNE